jgi:hypothetical protein
MMQPPLPGQLPPEDLQAFLAAQEHASAVRAWYEKQMMRLETEHRERTLQFAAILCRCLQHEPCPVHSTVHISADGRVL